MIEERSLAIRRAHHAPLTVPRTLFRVAAGYVSVDVGELVPGSDEPGSRAFFFNAVSGDLVPGGVCDVDGNRYAFFATAAADATLEPIDGPAAGPAEREKLERRFAALFERIGAEPVVFGPRDLAAETQIAFERFVRAYVESTRAAGQREALRLTESASVDRTALHREAFEASHVLDRHPIPVDPSDDDITAAARIVIGAIGGTLVRPMKADRDSASAVRAIALASHLIVRRIALRGSWWLGEHGPLIGFSKDGRPIALLPRSGRSRYELIDPIDPRVRRPLDAALANDIAEVAYMFAPTLPHREAGALALFRIGLRDSGADLLRVVLLGFLAGILASVLPLAVAPLIDAVLPGGLRGILLEIVALLAIVVVVAAVLDVVRNLSVVRAKARLSAQTQQAVIHRLIGLMPTFYRRYSVGDLASRALGIDAIEAYIGDATLTTLLTAIFSLVSFGVVLYEDAVVGLVCGAIAVLAASAFVAQAWILMRYRRKTLELGGQLSGFVYQTLTGMAKIRAAAARNRVYVRWFHRFLEIRRISAASQKIEYRFGIFESVLPSLATVAIVATVLFARDGRMEPGTFFTILAAFGQLLGGLLALGYNVSSMIAIVPIYERLKPILDELPERAESAGDPGPLSGKIALRNVTFTYEGTTRPALSNFSLEIEPGTFVAIVGPSGSGKSTLLRLLLGFERPESGSIAYDDHDLDSLDISSVRRQIGAVLQTAKLMPGSIFDNIAGNAILTREEAWIAARRVGLDHDIEAMPMKLDTMIGANGGGLSGGQRQRIVIARAIARAPKLIFFDEATSALDNATQAVVSDTLRDLDATRIVIAHRLSTVVDADRIVVVERGAIVQDGTYAALLATPGPFQTLAQRQRL